ncbi:MAG: peptidylprolyl isomerase [Candidatus Eiseniibacteriota bacterium]
MTRPKRRNASALSAAGLAFLLIGATPAAKAGTAKAAPAKTAAPTVVATVGSRKVDSADIQRAAASLSSDPLRKKDPAAWRRMLLDRCADRELLAMEAERQGLDKDPALRKKIAEREYLILLREMYAKVLVPNLIPTPDQLRDIRTDGLYRGVDLYYILVRDNASGQNRPLAQRVLARAQSGARFDSLARIYSGHPPSQAAGGHFGWVLARDLDPQSYNDIRKAKVGDVIGVYSGAYGHEIYKIGAFQELSEDSLYNLVYFERKKGIANDYEKSVLAKYHFALDSTQVKPVVFATGTESPDSLLASFGPNGTRLKSGVRPAIGVLATCDGDTVTFPELVQATPPVIGENGRMRIPNVETLYRLSARVVLHDLTVRDAKDRGLDKDPEIARELRLTRDQILTSALVERNLPPRPDDTALRATIEAHPDRFRKPPTSVAKVAVFLSRGDADQARKDWASGGMSDTALAARQLKLQPRTSARTLLPGHYATLSFAEGGADSLNRAIHGVAVGGFAPVVATEQGWAVAQVTSTEDKGPMAFEDARFLALREWRDQSETKWVEQEVAKLRSMTPVKTVPGRLEAVSLAPAGAAPKSAPASTGKATP